jgi:hypothetical protein
MRRAAAGVLGLVAVFSTGYLFWRLSRRPAARRTPVRKALKSTKALLELVKPRLSELTSRPDQYQRQFAAAALTRCLALLEGVVALGEVGLEEDAGVLARSLAETWAVGAYVLLGPDGAVDDFAFDAKESIRKFRDASAKLKPLSADESAMFDRMLTRLDAAAKRATKKTKAGDPRDVNYSEIMEQDLPKLLGKRDPDDEDLGKVVYAHIYRIESTFSTHAGLASIAGYLDADGDSATLVRPPRRPFLDGEAEKACALLTGHLAALVFESFGRDPKPFKDACLAIRQEGQT